MTPSNCIIVILAEQVDSVLEENNYRGDSFNKEITHLYPYEIVCHA